MPVFYQLDLICARLSNVIKRSLNIKHYVSSNWSCVLTFSWVITHIVIYQSLLENSKWNLVSLSSEAEKSDWKHLSGNHEDPLPEKQQHNALELMNPSLFLKLFVFWSSTECMDVTVWTVAISCKIPQGLGVAHYS